jgi:hypothetical protein
LHSIPPKSRKIQYLPTCNCHFSSVVHKFRPKRFHKIDPRNKGFCRNANANQIKSNLIHQIKFLKVFESLHNDENLAKTFVPTYLWSRPVYIKVFFNQQSPINHKNINALYRKTPINENSYPVYVLRFYVEDRNVERQNVKRQNVETCR